MTYRICLLALIIFAVLTAGCGKSSKEISIIKKVNADNKNFSGKWVYKFAGPGAAGRPPGVRVSINITIDGRKFQAEGDWGRFDLRKMGGPEKWVFNGRKFWHLVPNKKLAERIESKPPRYGQFWKMPYRLKPLPAPVESGEDEVAGRKCIVLKTTGKYDKGDVELTYWIDKDKFVLLKKEHRLMGAGLVLAHEIYECQEIEHSPHLEKGTFDFSPLKDWKIEKKYSFDCEFLTTKF